MAEEYKTIHIRSLLDTKDYEVIKPIPVIVEHKKEQGCYFARAGELGIKCPGVGETIEEACKELVDIILTEADVLRNSKRTLRGDDELKVKKINEYLKPLN